MLAMTGWSSSLLAVMAAAMVVVVVAGGLLGRRRETLDDIHRPRLARGERRRVRARLGKVVL